MTNIQYRIEIEPDEVCEVQGSFSSGDEAADKALVESIYERFDAGDVWAWCMVKVIAECEGFTGFDTLCGCSYADEEDFKKGGYYEQMCDAAREELLDNMKAAVEKGKLAAKMLSEHQGA